MLQLSEVKLHSLFSLSEAKWNSNELKWDLERKSGLVTGKEIPLSLRDRGWIEQKNHIQKTWSRKFLGKHCHLHK